MTWVLFVKQRGISPLAAGQWGPYLAFYAGFWTINNLYAAPKVVIDSESLHPNPPQHPTLSLWHCSGNGACV